MTEIKKDLERQKEREEEKSPRAWIALVDTKENRAAEIKQKGDRKTATTGGTLQPWMFRHNDLIKALSSAKKIGRKNLTNILNYLHFKDNSLYVLLRHPRYSEDLLFVAYHEPCLGTKLVCRWDEEYKDYKLKNYRFQYLIVFYKQSVILIPPDSVDLEDGKFTLQLPEESFVINRRHFSRFNCEGIRAELWQNGFQASGRLVDFSFNTFKIQVQVAPPYSFHWFNDHAQSTVRLFDDNDVYYFGNCRCEYQTIDRNVRAIVLTPIQDQIEGFKLKGEHPLRWENSPRLYAVFKHPFIKKEIKKEIFDISASGFSLFDEPTEAVLMPGMIIPNLVINFGDVLKVFCLAQVVYKKEEGDQIRFGVAILDMNLKNLNAFNQLLNNVLGTPQGMTNEVDLDELWEMLFESGFIYPEKYDHIQAFKKSFQETYKKLYTGSSEIAKYFVYQKNEKIYSHASLIRAYEKAWMGHHLAARPEEGRHTGLIVLKKMLGYLYEMRRFPSAYLDYYITFYRPENRFTGRIYSGFAEKTANPGVCSMDRFAYTIYTKENKTPQLPEGWSLGECGVSDLFEFERFYRHRSGGLLWNVLALDIPESERNLEQAYAAEGLTRRYKAFSLSCYGDLRAILIREESDSALNLSDLLNGFKIFVLDDELPANVIFSAVDLVLRDHEAESLPLMIYPAEYASRKEIHVEKEYILWIIDAGIGSKFAEYIEKRYRIKVTEAGDER